MPNKLYRMQTNTIRKLTLTQAAIQIQIQIQILELAATFALNPFLCPSTELPGAVTHSPSSL